MIRYPLDTSVYSQRLRRKPIPGVVRRWSAIGDTALATSIICEAEVLFGLEKQGSNRLRLEYDQYLRNKLVVLPLDRKVTECYARIKADMLANGIIIGEFDLLIGATALSRNLVVATLNTRDFSKIPGLQFEDWSEGN